MSESPSSQDRVIVFIDGQNLYKRCKELFGHPLCHPHLLAEYLAGSRRLVSTRFYTGRPDPNDDRRSARNLDRRLNVMSRVGVKVTFRPLRYHWDWTPTRQLPRAGENVPNQQAELMAYQRPQEKGIDLALGLDVIELAVRREFDTAIIVSLDRDLHEIPKTILTMTDQLELPVRIEAAVPVPEGRKRPKTLSDFAYTHQITRDVFDRVRDDTDYTIDTEKWKPPRIPTSLAHLGSSSDL